MAQQVIDETVATQGGSGIGVRTLGRWLHLTRVVTRRLLRAHSARETGPPRAWAPVRLFTTGRHKSRERVVTCQPGTAFAYELEAGLPLQGYKAVITLLPGGGAGRRSTGARHSGPR